MNNVSEHHRRRQRGVHLRALLRVHRVLLGAALLQPHHQLDHRARGAAPEPRALRAGLPPARVRARPPGHEQRLLLPDPPGRAAGAPRLPGHDHRPDQQRLQHPADAHRHGAGPLLRRVPPDALQLHLHGGGLALAAGRAHLDDGAGDPAQPVRAAELAVGLQRGVRARAAEEGRPAEGALHRPVHRDHPLQLRAHPGGGPAAGRAQQAQPGRMQDHRPARHPAGGVHPPQLRELRAHQAGAAGDQGAVRRGHLRLLQPGAVRRARRLRPAQRGAPGAAEPQVPLLLQIPQEHPGLDCERQLGSPPPQSEGANADGPDDHLSRGATSPKRGGGNQSDVGQEFLT